MRVYELANQLGVSSRDLLLFLEQLGVGGKTASSTVPPVHLGKIRTHFQSGGEAVEDTAAGEAPAAEKKAPTAKRAESPAEAPAPGTEAGSPTPNT